MNSEEKQGTTASLVEQASLKARQLSSSQYNMELVKESLDFESIDELEYVNRKKALLTQDDALNLQCDCRTQFDDELICEDERCINYTSRTECPLGTCSKRRCGNKRFQKKQWKEVEVTPTEKKGNGLFLCEPADAGDFLIEYVGEVISENEYNSRMDKYRQEKRKHFYMLQIRKQEYIDACQKGNVARFINHSCEPNCRTEVWHVGKEERVGIFAIRDIRAQEELCFDYQWQRIGEDRIKCYCGTASCRGYLGAKEDDRAGLPCGRFREPHETELGAGKSLINKFVRVHKDNDDLIGSSKSRAKAVKAKRESSVELSEDVVEEDEDGIWFAARVSDYNSTTGGHKLAYLLDDTIQEEDLRTDRWQILEASHLGPTTALDEAEPSEVANLPRRHNAEQMEELKREYQQQLQEEEDAAAVAAVERQKRARKLLEKTQRAWEKKLEEQEKMSRRKNREIAEQLRKSRETEETDLEEQEQPNSASKIDMRRKMESFLQQDGKSQEQEALEYWGESVVSHRSTATSQASHYSGKRSRQAHNDEKSRKKRRLKDKRRFSFTEYRNHAGEVNLRPTHGSRFPFELSWRFAVRDVISPPSKKHGFSLEDEYLWRYHAQLLVAQSARDLEVSFRMMLRAMLITHKFCSACSLKNIPLRAVVSASLLIAHKFEMQVDDKQKFSVSRISRRVAKTAKEMISKHSKDSTFSQQDEPGPVRESIHGYCCGVLYENSFSSPEQLQRASELSAFSPEGMTSTDYFAMECLRAVHTERLVLGVLRFCVDDIDVEGIIGLLDTSWASSFLGDEKRSKTKRDEILKKHPWLQYAARAKDADGQICYWRSLTQLVVVISLITRPWLWNLHVPEAVISSIAHWCAYDADPENVNSANKGTFELAFQHRYLYIQSASKTLRYSSLKTLVTGRDIRYLLPFVDHRFGVRYSQDCVPVARLACPTVSNEDLEKDIRERVQVLSNMINDDESETSISGDGFSETLPVDLLQSEQWRFRHEIALPTSRDDETKLRTVNDFEFVGQLSGGCYVAIDHGRHLDKPKLVLLKKWPERGCEQPSESLTAIADQKLYGLASSAFCELNYFRILHCPWRDTNPKEELVQSIYEGISRSVSSPSRAKVNRNIILPVEMVVGESFLSSMSYVVGDNDSIPVQTADPPCTECDIAGVPDIPDGKLREENFMVMEYLPHNLKGLTMAGVNFTPPFQLKFSSSVLKAVRALHRHDIVHHHINCNHVLLSDTGEVRLYGLGDAKSFDRAFVKNAEQKLNSKPSKVDETEIVSLANSFRVDPTKKAGSAHVCRPPELLIGCSLYLPASDMWSLGCVLAEAYLGEPLFDGTATIKELATDIARFCGNWRKAWPMCKRLTDDEMISDVAVVTDGLKAHLMKKNLPEPQAKLLSHLLQINPVKRVTAESALRMSFFKKHSPPPDDRLVTFSAKFPFEELRIDPSAPVEGSELAQILPLRSYEMRLRERKAQVVLDKSFWRNVLQRIGALGSSPSGENAGHPGKNGEIDSMMTDTSQSGKNRESGTTPTESGRGVDSRGSYHHHSNSYRDSSKDEMYSSSSRTDDGDTKRQLEYDEAVNSDEDRSNNVDMS
eukprot:gb/GECG01004771.1/.p1 GENE.gb/GECG01004771.1/~~gb/GECG01004771.1/.p1  ORF type:complete len:1590 (+),score=252.34 gb/GECG01004771.1/:1-4770(+)